jgi:hypothetical protein
LKSEQDVREWLRGVECLPRRLSAAKAEQRAIETSIEDACREFDTLTNSPVAPEVMRLHYVDGLEWWKVANAVNYSTRVVLRISADSVRELAERA